MGMNILAGGPARETDSALYRLHVDGLEAQGMDMDVRHKVSEDPGGPRWYRDKIHAVAQVRQEFLDAAERGSSMYLDCHGPYDALFMVDTDVILGPGVLERMWEVDADVVYGVFWTRCDWGGSEGDWPQVWDVNPYGWTQETADALKEDGVNEVEVYGGGACTLFRGRAFESRYWPVLESIQPRSGMWSGEDRSYCLGLECRGIRQVAVTGLPIVHCYDVGQKTEPALESTREGLGL